MLYIFTLKKDFTLDLLRRSASRKKVNLKIYYYDDLYLDEFRLYDERLKLLSFSDQDRVILRSFDDSSYMFKYLLSEYSDLVIINSLYYKAFPYCADKLFQVRMLRKLKVPYPKTFYCPSLEIIKKLKIKFPFVLKKRTSSRSKDVYYIQDSESLGKIIRTKDLNLYLIQEYIQPVIDYRILIFRNKIIGGVRRNVVIKTTGKIRAKTSEVDRSINTMIKQDVVRATKELKIDLAGIDVVVDKSGKHYFIEINRDPQFRGFADVTGINPWDLILDYYKGEVARR